MPNIDKLSQRIDKELDDIEMAVERAADGWQRYESSSDDFYLDSVALSLHGFYSGVENVLENIATSMDRQLPGGERWHIDLLQQMAKELPDVRPAVISESTAGTLLGYLKFRHLVRNIYSYRIDPVKLAPLAEGASEAFDEVSRELKAFSRWLMMN